MNIQERTMPHVESDLDAFSLNLSKLCRKYGIGITGNPTLFVMESVDYQLSYCTDEHRDLQFN